MILSVNNINLLNVNKVRFTAKPENSKYANELSGEKHKKDQIHESEKAIKTSTKVTIGVSLALLAATGIYIATNWKKGLPKNILSLSEFNTQGQLVKG